MIKEMVLELKHERMAINMLDNELKTSKMDKEFYIIKLGRILDHEFKDNATEKEKNILRMVSNVSDIGLKTKYMELQPAIGKTVQFTNKESLIVENTKEQKKSMPRNIIGMKRAMKSEN